MLSGYFPMGADKDEPIPKTRLGPVFGESTKVGLMLDSPVRVVGFQPLRNGTPAGLIEITGSLHGREMKFKTV